MYKATLSFTTKNYDVRKNQILAEDFTTQSEIDEYLSIGYIVEYDGTLEITQNGLYDVEDYEQANVDVPSGEPTLQSKSVTITTNTTTNIQADEGYDGLSQVAVTTNVTSDNNAKIDTAPQTAVNVRLLNMCIKELPETFDLSNVTGTAINELFKACAQIVNAPNLLFTTSVVFAKSIFASCTNLVNVPVYNFSKITNMQYAFDNCPSLSNESLNNILYMCANSNITINKTLAYIGLSPEQATTCQSLSNWSALSALGWTTGY